MNPPATESPTDTDTPLVELRGMTKRFGHVTANDGVSFTLRKGEIHGLLGENGAGKSTLMEVLFGVYVPDEGQILIRGEEAQISSPRKRIAAGIGMVHQHFMLVPEFTVVENITMGYPGNPFVLRPAAAARRVRELCEEYGLFVDPEAKVADLSVGEAQKVEIIRAFFRGAEIIVLDEPSSRLAPPEIVELGRVMKKIRDGGGGVIFTSHKLQESLDLCDRITVLRRGKNVATVDARTATREQLASLMIGRPVVLNLDKPPAQPGAPLLELASVSLAPTDRNRALEEVSLELRAGEIFGIAGVDGNGQTELAEVILGLRAADEGTVRLLGEDVGGLSTKERADRGLGCVPGDRHKEGLALDMTVGENIVMRKVRSRPLSNRGFLALKTMRKTAGTMVDEHDVQPRDPRLTAAALSGGNQQKIVVARELDREPRVLVVMQPTAGLDVGAAEQVYRRLFAAAGAGTAILLISTELGELLSVSDRVAVMSGGRLGPVRRTEDVALEQIGLEIAGVRDSSETGAEKSA